MQRDASRRGVQFERVDYLPAADNAKGECQRRYYDVYIPPAGGSEVFFYLHGGGGDVGSADYANVSEICMKLTRKGFIAVSIEYRRGWTGTEALDQWCDPNRDPHNATPEQYNRERIAAEMSFADVDSAVRHAYARLTARYGFLVSHVTGTSFGGASAVYVAYGSPGLANEIYLQGCLNQFGGMNQDADFFPTVSYYGAGGVADDLVPFWEGPFFVHPNGIPGYGVGGLGDLARSHGLPTAVVGTCNKGHGRGVMSEEQLIEDYLDFIEMGVSRPTEFLNGARSADSCYYSWQDLRARL